MSAYPQLTKVVQSVANPKDYRYQLVPRLFAPFISVRDYSGTIWNQL